MLVSDATVAFIPSIEQEAPLDFIPSQANISTTLSQVMVSSESAICQVPKYNAPQDTFLILDADRQILPLTLAQI